MTNKHTRFQATEPKWRPDLPGFKPICAALSSTGLRPVSEQFSWRKAAGQSANRKGGHRPDRTMLRCWVTWPGWDAVSSITVCPTLSFKALLTLEPVWLLGVLACLDEYVEAGLTHATLLPVQPWYTFPFLPLSVQMG